MNKPFRNFSILLLVIIIVPVLFFSFYEITRMNKNERELELVYNKQLDAILFSINLYSEDIVQSWSSKIRGALTEDGCLDTTLINKLLQETKQIKSINIQSTNATKQWNNYSLDQNADYKTINANLNKLSSDSALRFNRLKAYLQAGYRKINPFEIENSLFVFFYIGTIEKPISCFIQLDDQRFIHDVLGQKIQMTAEGKMNIGVSLKESGKLIYTSGTKQSINTFQSRRSLWLLPQYEIGISLKDKSLEGLSKQRGKLNLLFILLADIIFILAAFLIYRNIRREIRLTQLKSEFISNVSHEIRTPLSLITMYAETLDMGRVKTDEKLHEYYSVIYNEYQRLTGIVNRILNFSKMEEGKRRFQFTSLNLNDLVENVMKTYSFHLKNKGFNFSVELHDLLPEIQGDTEAISDTLINILDNAVKYSVESKNVSISTGLINNYAFIQVTDRGIGISTEHQKFIYDKFFRVTQSNLAHLSRGTGLGLTIVKNIVTAHNGRIELESTLGDGSTFRILFPIK